MPPRIRRWKWPKKSPATSNPAPEQPQVTHTATLDADRRAIAAVLDQYRAGAVSGRVADLKDAFHADAMIHGYVGPDLFAGPIHNFYEWHESNGPAPGLAMTIADIDIEGTIATARIEITDWTGHRFTDMFTLLKTGGQWKIISKVFYLHE